jgi:hypothetical protein
MPCPSNQLTEKHFPEGNDLEKILSLLVVNGVLTHIILSHLWNFPKLNMTICNTVCIFKHPSQKQNKRSLNNF